MQEISETRFNAIAGYARHPLARVTGEELRYFEGASGSILGIMIRDRTDGDFAGLAFGRDKKLKFRASAMTSFFETPDEAFEALGTLVTKLTAESDEFHYQGDEVGEPVDFFTPVHPPEKLHPSFCTLISQRGFSPAREIIAPMMRWHEDLDGNFVEQFQSTAFDQRIWELYLFATLTELGYKLDGAHHIPDFIASGLLGQVAIEAVTVGPTKQGNAIVPPPPTSNEEEVRAYLTDYMPIKYGSALFSKLRKEYWKQPQIKKTPFVLAVADFSSPTLPSTTSALERYLYGYSWEASVDSDGVRAPPVKLTEHRWGEKVIPSGFFGIPEADNISAVISTSAGTISKFNRMGLLSGFGDRDVLMIRRGTCVDGRPEATGPKIFEAVVNAADYRETWVEGMDVYHNPRAKLPLPKSMFPGTAHHWCDQNGSRRLFAPQFHPMGSTTRIETGIDIERVLKEHDGANFRVWGR
ncbi:hypothetical protein [Rhizobium leguminosarum]|uniref:hypothetical protein n=1 Tax=Rhizobium leguminosarum TaxID=384 RepID=UPI0015FAF988|nr:hypothetical protein [Rhizobium leguminosarum]MBA9030399.1 hypothetical protein [Rhizobium leguminosarum]